MNLTRAAALDCAPQRIHVNSIGPGYTESAMTSPLFANPATKAKLLAKHPFRGLGKPEDIARVCLFLASEESQWCTGVITVLLPKKLQTLTRRLGVYSSRRGLLVPVRSPSGFSVPGVWS